MHVTLVEVRVKPEHVAEFIDATRANSAASVHESGNVRFDVLQLPDDPTHFVLYEAYRSAEDARAHKDTAHYLAWRERVADWMAAPRQGTVYHALEP